MKPKSANRLLHSSQIFGLVATRSLDHPITFPFAELFSSCSPCRIGSLSAGLGLLLAGMSSQSALGAAISWDKGAGGGDLTWANTLNWDPDSAAAGNDITFEAKGVAATGSVTNIVDSSVTINSLSFTNTGGSASAQTTQINSNQTLTVNGTGSAFTVGTSTTASSVNAYITGAGNFSVTGGSTANFSIGTSAIASSSGTQTLDMSGLANFSADVGVFALGTGTRNAGVVTLAGANSITATSVTIGNNTSSGGPQSILNLGQTNTIYTDTITIGTGRDSGLLQFQTLTGATVAIANRANNGGANLNVGLLDTNASSGPTSTADFSGGTLTGTFATIQLGRSANSNAGGSATGNLTFGAGTMNATSIVAGLGNSGSSASATGIGNISMTANAGTLTATTVTLGSQTQNNNTSRLNGATGSFSQNGGTAVITTLNIGDRQNTSTAGNVTGTYNLAGGTLKAGTIQAGNNGSGGGTVTRTFAWTGGTIQNLNSSTNLTIASTNGLTLSLNGASTLTFNADANRSIAVNAVLTGANGFTKSGLGTLALTGANDYNGGTIVDSGKVNVKNGSLGAGLVTLNGGSVALGVGELVGNYTTNNNFILNGGALVAEDWDQHVAGTVNVASASTIGSTYNNGGGELDKGLFLDGAVSGSANLTVNQQYAGTNAYNTSIVYFTNNANTYSGTITVAPGASGSGGNFIALGGNGVNGATALANATVNLDGSNPSNDRFGSSMLVFTTDLPGAATLGGLSGSDNVVLTEYNANTHAYTSDSVALTVGNNNSSTTYSGVMSGGGSLTKIGSGTLTLSSANTYTGVTNLNEGTLKLNNPQGAGTATSPGQAMNLANGTTLELNFNSSTQLTNNLTVTGTATLALGSDAGGTLNIGNNSASNNGAISSSGTATLKLKTANASNLTLNFNGAMSGFTGTVLFDNAASSGITLRMNGTTNSNYGSVNTLYDLGTNTANVLQMRNGGLGGTLVFNLGGLQGGAGTTLRGAGSDSSPGETNAMTYSIGALGTNTEFSGNIVNGTALTTNGGTASVAITKVGTGTLTLYGTNTYTGATAVSAGTLLIGTSGSLANTAVTVGGSAASGTPTLAGGGTIGGATIIASAGGGVAGTHSVGVAGVSGGVGTQTFSSTLTYQTGSIFEWDMVQAATGDPGESPAAEGVNAGTYDTVTMSGAANSLQGSGAIFEVLLGSGKSFADAFWDTDKSWNNIFSGTGATGVNLTSIFSSFGGAGVAVDGTVATEGKFTFNGSTTLTWNSFSAVPEPTSALAGLLLGAGLLRRRRKN